LPPRRRSRDRVDDSSHRRQRSPTEDDGGGGTCDRWLSYIISQLTVSSHVIAVRQGNPFLQDINDKHQCSTKATRIIGHMQVSVTSSPTVGAYVSWAMIMVSEFSWPNEHVTNQRGFPFCLSFTLKKFLQIFTQNILTDPINLISSLFFITKCS
jgi:hypothetical protein